MQDGESPPIRNRYAKRRPHSGTAFGRNVEKRLVGRRRTADVDVEAGVRCLILRACKVPLRIREIADDCDDDDDQYPDDSFHIHDVD